MPIVRNRDSGNLELALRQVLVFVGRVNLDRRANHSLRTKALDAPFKMIKKLSSLDPIPGPLPKGEGERRISLPSPKRKSHDGRPLVTLYPFAYCVLLTYRETLFKTEDVE